MENLIQNKSSFKFNITFTKKRLDNQSKPRVDLTSII